MIRGTSAMRTFARRAFRATGSAHTLTSSARPTTTMTMMRPRAMLPAAMRVRAFCSAKEEGEKKDVEEEEKEGKEEKVDEESESSSSSGESESEPSEVEQLQAQLEAKDKELKDMKDAALRAMADLENTRKIAEKDVENARQYALSGFAKNLLEVVDTLDLAVKAVEREHDDEHFKNLLEGVVMTEKILLKAMSGSGITKFESLDQPFDPNLHDGLYQFEDPNKEPGTVGNVIKDGYMINGRVLRPAHVGTVKKSA